MTHCDAAGYLASGLVFAAFCMKEMIPLRIVGICSNLAFIIYGLGLDLVPVWTLHVILLPMNFWRLWQALRHGREQTERDPRLLPNKARMQPQL
jgi:hypothetical protein